MNNRRPVALLWVRVEKRWRYGPLLLVRITHCPKHGKRRNCFTLTPIGWPWNVISPKSRSIYFPKSRLWSNIRDCLMIRILCIVRIPCNFISRSPQRCPKRRLSGRQCRQRSLRWLVPCRDMMQKMLFWCFLKLLFGKLIQILAKQASNYGKINGNHWLYNWPKIVLLRDCLRKKSWNVPFFISICINKKCWSGRWLATYISNVKVSAKISVWAKSNS